MDRSEKDKSLEELVQESKQLNNQNKDRNYKFNYSKKRDNYYNDN